MGTWWESGTECKNNIKDIHYNTVESEKSNDSDNFSVTCSTTCLY